MHFALSTFFTLRKITEKGQKKIVANIQILGKKYTLTGFCCKSHFSFKIFH